MKTRNLIKHFLQLFLPMSTAFGLIVIYFYTSGIEKERTVREVNEVLYINLGKQAMEKDLESAVADLRILSQHKEFERINGQSNSEALKRLTQEFQVFAKNKQYYDQIRFLDKAGMEVIRVNTGSGHPRVVPEDQLQDKSRRYYFKDAKRLKKGEVLITPLDLNIEHGKVERPSKPVMRLITTVFYGQEKNKGVVVLNYLGSSLIRDFKKAAAGSADHVMLLDTDGYWVHEQHAELERRSQLDRDLTFKKQFPGAWKRITSADAGRFYNSAGLFTFVTVYPLRDVWESTIGETVAAEPSRSEAEDKERQWKVVAHVPGRDLDASASAVAMRLLLICIPLFGLLVAVTWWMTYVRMRRLEAEDVLTNRIHQQSAVAELGQRALSGVKPAALMDTIVEYVAQVVEVEYCKVLELLSGGEALVLRAGVGWRQGLVGRETVGAGMDSQAGYTLECNDAVIVEDIHKETRFTQPQLLHDHGVVSGMSVVIHGVNRPFGVLGIHTSKRRTFTRDDVHFIQAVANILSEAIERDSAQAQTRLQSSALRAAADGILISDRDGNIQWVNPAYTRMTGYELDEVRGKNPRITKSGKQNQAFYKQMWDTILSGKVWCGELYNKRKDGSLYLEEESITPVLKDGEIGHFIAIKRDVTERQHLQQQLQQSQKMEAIGQLTGGIAHDFNNMLAPIMGYTELVREGLAQYDNEQIEGYLDEVFKSSKRARDLVRQMLAFSRGGEKELKPLMLSPMIKESLKMLGSTLPSTIEVSLQLKDNDVTIKTNPVLLHQLIMNLCINARDAMEGKGHITIGLRRGDSVVTNCCSCHKNIRGSFIQLFVRDTGCGIKPEQLDRIFGPFYTTKNEGKGSGMGLSMVHGIMHDHGGHVIVEAWPGKGSTFTLLFPVIDTQVDTVNLEDRNTNAALNQAFDGNVLIVDDEASVGCFIGELMKSRGFNVTVETNSKSALSRFNESPEAFDLVVTDQTMPGMTGEELAKAILTERPNFPVILCTGYSDLIDADKAKLLGISGYINKPIETDKFFKLVQELLQARTI